jgi:hypothetical protein
VMMTAAAIFPKFRLLIPHGLSGRFANCFCHGIFLKSLGGPSWLLCQESPNGASAEQANPFEISIKILFSDGYFLPTETTDNQNIIKSFVLVY